ncbi:Kiwa anti-phage protein KwaB-like domain-containing protein [Lysinibacillus fusiformis]|uniref:Kiwa anti-phage protein KwaB-like domain-containing protein n=1 Tax=Lysinibacillus fusiformis TaxID=28031 RepID=UPI003BA165E8
MNLRDVENIIEAYPDPQGRLSVLFVSKRGLNYEAFNPTVSNEVQEKLMDIFLNTLRGFINEELTPSDFNPSGQETGTFSVCPQEYTGNFNEVIELFENVVQEELQVEDISFLIHRLRINNDNEDVKYLYLFRRNTKMKKLRKGFWLQKIRNEYDVLDSELIGVDNFIDAIAYEGEVAFFAHISAERIFNLREKFAENAQLVLEELRVFNVFDNFEEFVEDSLEDARVTRRLTKIHYNPAILQLFQANYENVPEVIEEFDLNINFDESSNKIIYGGREQLSDITMLIRDAYYKTVLANRKGVDDYNN